VGYVALAQRLTTRAPRRLVITHGLSGCGKTVASGALLQSDPHAATLRLRSDVERRRLFGLPANARSGAQPGAGVYTPEAGVRTYARLREQAEMLLRADWSVVVDAAFLKRAERDAFRTLALDLGVAFSILAPSATPAELRHRIQERAQQGHDASEATLEVLAQQMQMIEPLEADETF
jgi:predicted kinase